MSPFGELIGLGLLLWLVLKIRWMRRDVEDTHDVLLDLAILLAPDCDDPDPGESIPSDSENIVVLFERKAP